MDITVADEADEAKALLSQSYFNGTLLRCANYGRITAVGGSWYTACVASLSYGPVTDCYNVADVTGGHTRYSSGGIGGTLSYQDYQDCRWFVDGDGGYGAAVYEKIPPAGGAPAGGYSGGGWAMGQLQKVRRTGSLTRSAGQK